MNTMAKPSRARCVQPDCGRFTAKGEFFCKRHDASAYVGAHENGANPDLLIPPVTGSYMEPIRLTRTCDEPPSSLSLWIFGIGALIALALVFFFGK